MKMIGLTKTQYPQIPFSVKLSSHDSANDFVNNEPVTIDTLQCEAICSHNSENYHVNNDSVSKNILQCETICSHNSENACVNNDSILSDISSMLV